MTQHTGAPRPNIAVIGCGHWGKNLVRNFAEIGCLYAICEADPARRQSIGDQYGVARRFDSAADLLADPQVDGVVVASPAEQHYDLGMAALRAGKDVFVEKPLTLDVHHGQDMVDFAQRNGRVLMVGHLLKYHPAVLKIQELLSAGELGKIQYIYSNRLSMGKIRREENALWSFAPHDISVILALTGQMPVQVTATGGAYLQPNIADVTVSDLLFDNGVRAHIFVSWLHPYKEQRLVVLGSKRTIVFEDSRPDRKLVMFEQAIELKNGSFEAGKPKEIPVEFDSFEPLRRECEQFIARIQDRGEPVTPGDEGVRVLHVLQSCQRSLQMNGEPVQIGPLSARRIVGL